MSSKTAVDLLLPCHHKFLPCSFRRCILSRRLPPIAARRPGAGEQFRSTGWRPSRRPAPNSAAFPVPHDDWLSHLRARRRAGEEQAGRSGLSTAIRSPTSGRARAGRSGTGTTPSSNPADFGISGDRTEHLLWRLDHGQVDGLHPKMVASDDRHEQPRLEHGGAGRRGHHRHRARLPETSPRHP